MRKDEIGIEKQNFYQFGLSNNTTVKGFFNVYQTKKGAR